MKKSISQFRKSPSIKFLLSRETLPVIAATVTTLTVLSCQINQSPQPTEPTAADKDDRATQDVVFPPLAPVPAAPSDGDDAVLLSVRSGEQDLHFGRVLGLACDGGAAHDPATLRIEVKLESVFGTSTMLFSGRAGDAGTDMVRGDVENAVLGFTLPGGTISGIAAEICKATSDGRNTTQARVTDDLRTQIRDWVETAAPDCESTRPVAGGFACELPRVDPESARQELLGIRSTMVRKWSRQPYLLARRLALGINLSDALQAAAPERDLNVFCNVIRNSDKVELPVVLATQRWQSTACNSTLPLQTRHKAAAFALAKTVSEIDFMRQVFERTSRLGSLVVRIPGNAAPSSRIFVSLQPSADVTEKLAQTTGRLRSQEAAPDDLPRVCWHPVFGESQVSMHLARSLTIAGDGGRAACGEGASVPPSGETSQAVEKYFSDSITSETEFIISNGRSRTLRLPAGTYHYTLRALPENSDDWDDAAQNAATTTGTVVWGDKRPRPVISSW